MRDTPMTCSANWLIQLPKLTIKLLLACDSSLSVSHTATIKSRYRETSIQRVELRNLAELGRERGRCLYRKSPQMSVSLDPTRQASIQTLASEVLQREDRAGI